ncbi:MAG: nucleotidyltransferase family protein [Thaumarchaeota archaeon]|nr:nucleotidyltransferase family protein [Nitrososphaerota archaeon]
MAPTKRIRTSWPAWAPGETQLKNSDLQAVILAGGLGTRLRPYTFLLPKPMLPVGPKPILEHILGWLRREGITDVVISTGYLGKMVHEYFGDGSEWGTHVSYAASSRPLGTAGQLKAAEAKVKGRFICLYGDALLDFKLGKVVDFHEKSRAAATMVLMKYSTELKYGFIETDSRGRLAEWKEKPKVAGYINVGCYVMEKKFLEYIPAGRMYGMKETFARARADGARLYAMKVEGEFTDIGDRRSYREANDQYMKKMGKVV